MEKGSFAEVSGYPSVAFRKTAAYYAKVVGAGGLQVINCFKRRTISTKNVSIIINSKLAQTICSWNYGSYQPRAVSFTKMRMNLLFFICNNFLLNFQFPSLFRCFYMNSLLPSEHFWSLLHKQDALHINVSIVSLTEFMILGFFFFFFWLRGGEWGCGKDGIL